MQFKNRYVQEVLRQVHLWLGLVAGLFIVAMGLSGFVSVYRLRLGRAAAPAVARRLPGTPPGTMPANLGAIAANLELAYPGATIKKITLPETAAEPMLVQAELKNLKRVQIYFDPATAKELGEKKSILWLDWIVDFHQNLLMGNTGRALTGAIGAALLLLSLSGAFSWLAGNRDWRRSLAVPQAGPWRRVNFQTHKWAGLWVNVLLIVVSSTGMVLAWPTVFQRMVATATGEAQRNSGTLPGHPGERAIHRNNKQSSSLDDYVRAAKAAVPQGVVREIRLSGKSVSVTMWIAADIRPHGGNLVLLDPASAGVVSVERASATPLSLRLVEWANAIHKTELGGLPLQIPWSLLGLAPALLFVSGIGIWWQRRQARRRSVSRARAGSEAVVERMLVHK